MGAEIKGAAELAAKLKKLQEDARVELENAVADGANVIRDRARHTSSFEDQSGLLRDSIVTARRKDAESGNVAFVVTVKGPAARYGRMLEFGTSKMKARPFLRPAADTGQAEAGRVVAEKAKQAIERAAKK